MVTLYVSMKIGYIDFMCCHQGCCTECTDEIHEYTRVYGCIINNAKLIIRHRIRTDSIYYSRLTSSNHVVVYENGDGLGWRGPFLYLFLIQSISCKYNL